MKLLTEEEIAELRRNIAIADELHAPGPWQETTRLLDEVERSRALLKEIEWSGEVVGQEACPDCRGLKPGGPGAGPDYPVGHASDCGLAELIGKVMTPIIQPLVCVLHPEQNEHLHFKFRPHRGSLAAAMSEATEVQGWAALLDHLRLRHPVGAPAFDPAKIAIESYGGEDRRIGWKNTFLVTLVAWGPLGFCEVSAPK